MYLDSSGGDVTVGDWQGPNFGFGFTGGKRRNSQHLP